MSKIKTIALATALVFGAAQLALAAETGAGSAGTDTSAGGGGVGTTSGHPSKAQNNHRGPGKNPGGGSAPAGQQSE